MNYSKYSVGDFVIDEFFQEWIKNPDATSNAFWHNWTTSNPSKRSAVEEARQIILSFNYRRSCSFDEHIERELARLHQSIVREEQNKSQLFK